MERVRSLGCGFSTERLSVCLCRSRISGEGYAACDAFLTNPRNFWLAAALCVTFLTNVANSVPRRGLASLAHPSRSSFPSSHSSSLLHSWPPCLHSHSLLPASAHPLLFFFPVCPRSSRAETGGLNEKCCRCAELAARV